MTAVFTAAPQFTVFAGCDDIGSVDLMLLTEKVNGPRVLPWAGRSWHVRWIDWTRRRCFVETAEGVGRQGG